MNKEVSDQAVEKVPALMSLSELCVSELTAGSRTFALWASGCQGIFHLSEAWPKKPSSPGDQQQGVPLS